MGHLQPAPSPLAPSTPSPSTFATAPPAHSTPAASPPPYGPRTQERPPALRLLLVADTHLGFDEPLDGKGRIERRRRGPDFLANFERALEPALRGEVDLVVHGGDLLYRSQVPFGLVERAMRPIARVAALGVPFFLVPGNHERSRLPFPLLAAFRNVFVFDRPRTFTLQTLAGTVALSGFPFARDVRATFRGRLFETGHGAARADLKLLCLHQAIEGGKAGTPDYTFRDGADVVRARDLPAGFAAILSGHLHRPQRLTRALDGSLLPAPVFYPGSVERTSFAERLERKGYLLLTLRAGGREGGEVERCTFAPLPARPMHLLTLGDGDVRAGLRERLRRLLGALPEDAVVRVGAEGRAAEAVASLGAAALRSLAPATMNVEVSPPGVRPPLPRR
jgi:DNA repair protein SbcD/Mre11